MLMSQEQKDNSLQAQAGARGHSVVLLSGKMLLCAHFAFQLSRLVHSEGILKQITKNTGHCNGAAVIQCQRFFPFTFIRAAFASVSAMQNCHISLALQSLAFVGIRKKNQTRNLTKTQKPF